MKAAPLAPSQATPTDAPSLPPSRGAGPGLCLGFGAAVVMWAGAYLTRLPFHDRPAAAPDAWVLFCLILLAYVAAGFLAGRWSRSGAGSGARVGAVAGLVNLLVLGGLIGKEAAGTAWAWLPGSLLAGAALGALGGAIGRATGPAEPAPRDWTAGLTKVLVLATLSLIPVGGFVTSHDAGLAVPDWPNTYGSNMFLYPLSRMSGGIYFEHAHRLIGALVGLTTLVTAWAVIRSAPVSGALAPSAQAPSLLARRAPALLAAALVPMVILQGVMGGLRVTEISIALAIFHGTFGQVFLALTGALAALSSPGWRAATPQPHEAGAADRALSAWAVGLVLAQLLLGALTRHLPQVELLVVLHVTMAVVVAVVAIACGVRSWGLHPEKPALRRSGLGLAFVVGTQLLLGVTALVARETAASWEAPVATAHQTTGAVILLLVVQVFLWQRRLVAPAPEGPEGPDLLVAPTAG